MASMLKDEEAEEEESGKRKRFTALLIAGVVAVLAVILFILTQDMRLPMVFIDFWTIAHVILLAGEIIALRAVYKKKDQEDEDDDDDGLEALLADAEA
jgi:pilus assembly protein TadC